MSRGQRVIYQGRFGTIIGNCNFKFLEKVFPNMIVLFSNGQELEIHPKWLKVAK